MLSSPNKLAILICQSVSPNGLCRFTDSRIEVSWDVYNGRSISLVSRFACSLLIVFSLTACSTQQISIPAKVDLKLVSDNIAVNVSGPIGDTVLFDRLTREIKARLILAGFDIEKQTDKKLVLNVNVSEFDPGDAAARLIVGFGAGRGSLIYTAEYVDAGGQIVAKMDGQERFTGGEIHFNRNYGHFTTLGGEETVREVLVKEAAKHIVELAVKPEP